jgi:hypothetical protein
MGWPLDSEITRRAMVDLIAESALAFMSDSLFLQMMATRIIVGASKEGAEADGEVLFPGVGKRSRYLHLMFGAS